MQMLLSKTQVSNATVIFIVILLCIQTMFISCYNSRKDYSKYGETQLQRPFVLDHFKGNLDDSKEQEWKQRRGVLQEICNILIAEHFTQLKASAEDVLKKIIINTEHHLGWCPIYKAASSLWFQIFAKMAKTSTQRIQSDRFSNVNVTTNQTRNLLIVRHPFQRLLSAFRDKLEHRRYREFYFQKYGKYIRTVYRVNANNSNEEPTFEEFLRYLVNEGIFDEHWRPYYIECFPCIIQYSDIILIETLEEDLKHFMTKYKLNLLNGIKMVSKTTTHEEERNYFAKIQRKLLYKVYKLYENDFRMFGYSPDDYYNITTD